MITAEAIHANYLALRQRMDEAMRQAGRDPGDVRLLVVTKGHPVEALRGLLEAGVQAFGENYVEEALEKEAVLGKPSGVQWHMIGHVQSRKAGQVVEHFEWLHALDSLKLGQRLSRTALEQGRRLPVLLECNVSGETSKFGFPAENEGSWPALLPDTEEILGLPGLDIRGLMCMAPWGDTPKEARPYFAKARRLRDFLRERVGEIDWKHLSMGMSADFEAAILEGATIVRIGSAILGPRPPR
jgi:hypothetical protein